MAELLTKALSGRVKLEDAGFDWKVLGPDVGDVDYVAWQCDQDAYACSGQKCSAQSLLFITKKWSVERGAWSVGCGGLRHCAGLEVIVLGLCAHHPMQA